MVCLNLFLNVKHVVSLQLPSMTDFLPQDYDVPSNGGKYMRFLKGENKFRTLTSPIIGWEYWITVDGKRKSIKVKQNETIKVSDLEDDNTPKHFWAMVVWNYQDKKIQILEITQKTIQKTIKSLSKDKEWGTPLDYDLSVIREGEGLETEYQVIPSPPKPLLKEIEEAYSTTPINLDALYEGGDPFMVKEAEITMEDMDNIPLD